MVNLREKLRSRRGILKSVLALLSSNVTAAALTAVGGVLVARFLGPEDVGAFRAFTIPLTYLIFLHLGTWDGLWRQIPYYSGKDQPGQAERVASAAGAFNLLVSGVVSGGFMCLATYSLSQKDFQSFFGWLSQAIFAWGVFYGGYLTSTFRTLHNFVALAKIEAIQAMIGFGMVFLLPILGFFGLCARAAVPSLVAVSLYHRKRPLRIKYRLDTSALGELIRIGLPFSFWGCLYTSVWTATEGALVLSLDGVSALGLFAVATVIRGAISSLPMSIWQVLTPRVVANLARDGSVRKSNARIMGVTAGLTALMIVVVLMASLMLDVFVPYFIPKYADGIQVMQVCLWFAVVQTAFLPMNTLFATGRAWLYGRSVIPGMLVFGIATYILVPWIGGLLAVAVGSLLGRAARTCAAYIDLMALARREA